VAYERVKLTYICNWSQTRDGRLSPTQTNAKVICILRSQ